MNVSLAEVVRAQVALLFGKYRPAGGLSEEETRAVRAERTEFGDRLVTMIRGIDAPEAAVVEQVRLVTRDVYADDRMRNLPTVESLCALVKRSFSSNLHRPLCFACVELGGHYRTADPVEPLQAKQRGEIEYAGHGWLCIDHSEVVCWYEHREMHRRGLSTIAGIRARFEYVPPQTLLPRASNAAAPPADDPKWASWTDGGNMGPLALWARAFVKRAYQHDVEEGAAPLLETRATDAPQESEAWRDL